MAASVRSLVALIVGLLATMAAALYPNILLAHQGRPYGLTIHNAASGHHALVRSDRSEHLAGEPRAVPWIERGRGDAQDDLVRIDLLQGDPRRAANRGLDRSLQQLLYVERGGTWA